MSKRIDKLTAKSSENINRKKNPLVSSTETKAVSKNIKIYEEDHKKLKKLAYENETYISELITIGAQLLEEHYNKK